MPEARSVFVPDVSRQTSLPLNGFRQNGVMEPLSHHPEQADQRDGPVEDWPDWGDPEESENQGGQSIQIRIQASERDESVKSRLPPSHTNMEEEPWNDFDDTESSPDLSTMAPLSEAAIPTPAGGTAASVKQAPGPVRLGSSKPLKLTSILGQITETKSSSSQDNGWAQEDRDSEKSSNPLNPNLKHTLPRKKGGLRGLGEEFTIKVKKKEQDQELDLFADMVPDIKLSSAALLPLAERSEGDAGLSAASPGNAKPVQVGTPTNTLTLAAKFAAVSLTEVSVSSVGQILLLIRCLMWRESK